MAGNKIKFFNLKTRKSVHIPVGQTKIRRLKNGATARTALMNGTKLFTIVKGSSTGRRSGKKPRRRKR